MAEIVKEIMDDKRVTVFKIKGRMNSDQIVEEITRFYENNFTEHTLWDLTEADLKHITTNEVQKIANHSKEYGHLRKNGRTALVMPSSLAFGLGRMYDSITQVISHPVKHGVFRNFKDAISWIGVGKQPDYPLIPGESDAATEAV